MHTLRALYRGLEALYGADSGLDPVAHLHTFTAAEGCGHEVVVIRESEQNLDIALALDKALLQRLCARPPAEVLGDDALADALPVIEGLSHLLYIAEAARRDRPISALELETQAEVDKLALCLFDRRHQAAARYEHLVDRLYYRFTLACDLSPALQNRYRTANRLALGFAQKLGRNIKAGRWNLLRRQLRRFWGSTLRVKRSLINAP